MFKDKRFKSQRANKTQAFIKQEEQIITASSHLHITPCRRYSFQQRSKSARGKLYSCKKRTAKYSLQHHNNPQEKVQIRLKHKQKDKVIVTNRIQRKIGMNSNKCFKLKIRQNKQKEQITPIMRIIIIDWLMQLNNELSLSKQALHHSIYYLDQLLTKVTITKNELQIYALCCLMIAQKLQSQIFLTPANATQLLKHQISEKDFICLQQQIIKELDFKLHPFTLWTEINILLKAFESYFKKELDEQWAAYRNRILWIIQGIVMENSYFKKRIIQTEICISLLYSIAIQYNSNLVKYFSQFCNSLKGAKGFRIQQMQSELKYVVTWLGKKCECVQIYSCQCYHPELKVMAASYLYN